MEYVSRNFALSANQRLTVADNHSVYDVLDKAFDDLSDLCDVVEEKFVESRDAFNQTR